MLSIFQNPASFPFDSNSVVTLGSFDGIHFGHQLIIKSIIEDASKINGKSVLITFNPHPQEIIQKNGFDFKLLTTLEEKLEILKTFDLDKVLVIPFTREFSELSAETFVEKTLLQKVGLKKITIGYDHMFGHNRTGSFSVLHQYGEKSGFDVEVVQAQQLNGVVVSSSKIRKALSDGDV
jgi:riboflavin kinase / FMN adenylyltransferase